MVRITRLLTAAVALVAHCIAVTSVPVQAVSMNKHVMISPTVSQDRILADLWTQMSTKSQRKNRKGKDKDDEQVALA